MRDAESITPPLRFWASPALMMNVDVSEGAGVLDFKVRFWIGTIEVIVSRVTYGKAEEFR